MIPIPIGTDRPRRQFPWMNALLITANVVIYLGSHQTSGGLAPGWEKFMLYPLHPQLQQFITYQFLHASLAHIGFNMLFLYVFGNNLNEKLGHAGYLVFYLTGGILAGCGQVLTSNVPTLGASGSISAVTGMFFILLPRTHVRMLIWFIVYVDVWEIPSMYFILFKVGQDIVEPLLGGSNVAHAAHLSGTATGFVLGLLLLLTGLVQRDQYDLLAMINRWRRRREYESIVAGGYNPFGAGGRVLGGTNAPAKPEDPRVGALRAEIETLLQGHELGKAVAKYLELRNIDPYQVLPMQGQLDVANQLMSDGQYVEAAGAYEDFLRVHGSSPQAEQVTLVLGIIYAKYWENRPRALELLKTAAEKMHDAGLRQLAQDELKRLEAEAGGR